MSINDMPARPVRFGSVAAEEAARREVGGGGGERDACMHERWEGVSNGNASLDTFRGAIE